MQKTFKEIMDMITNGELHYNQSTQRKFVYAGMKAIVSTEFSSGTTTKSGSLINAILEDNIQLPAIYFWYNTDTNQLNIHDGKQRILSLYYFVNPTSKINISTIRNNRETTWNGLSQADQNKILNYKFDIVERSGNSLEEERSFFLINTNGVPLTNYECLSGMFYGTFLSEFEDYIDAMSKTLDNVKPVNRGEQAYSFLLTMFDIKDSKKASGADASAVLLNNKIRSVRKNSFDATDYSFDKIIVAFNELMRTIKGIKEERALSIAAHIVRNGYIKDDIIDYYRQCMRLTNDIASWDMATHKTFIDKFVKEGLKLDPQRNFTKDIKDQLYSKSNRCNHINEDGTRCKETSYSKLEVDHVIPWSCGGRTTLDNAQLLCKHHNTSKGNRD